MDFVYLRRGAAALALGGIIGGGVWAQDTCEPVERQSATEKLIRLVDEDDGLKTALTGSIALGQLVNSDPKTNPVATLDDYYDFIDALVTYDPRNIDTTVWKGEQGFSTRIGMDGSNYCNWNILDLLSYSYFLVDRQLTTDPRGQIQFTEDAFSQWLRNVAEEWGMFLETKESARYVPEFTSDPYFGDWYCGAGSTEPTYETFQDFFVRELCDDKFPAGSRPVEGFNDPLTVVSIGDSTSAGWWPISEDGRLITDYDTVAQSGMLIKGKMYNDVHEFILGEPGETVLETFGSIDPSRFDGGTWTHQFLDVNNYHRLHVPVAGRIVYLRHFQSAVRLKSGWKADFGDQSPGYYDPRDTADWQFGQTRMVIGMETADHGLVVISPMGMAQVSGIDRRDWVAEGAMAEKGWEFANFKFGGSDFVVIFEEQADFVLTVPTVPVTPESEPGAGVNYELSLQGSRYGCFGGISTCSTVPLTPPPSPKDQPRQ
ncbi:MAG: phosphatidylserine decarboxylase [Rhodobacter sp.]|nr:phosphatidylserine decarboxylase [Rhodobacter sp.]